MSGLASPTTISLAQNENTCVICSDGAGEVITSDCDSEDATSLLKYHKIVSLENLLAIMHLSI
jgi:hypothetical protein